MTDTPKYNALRAAGVFDAALDNLAQWAPEWTEQYMGLVEDGHTNDVLEPKLVALIRLNIDVTATHLYAPGVRRHVRNALRLGASRAEILEVFKLASVVGIHACALGVPLLEEALAEAGMADDSVTA